MKTQVCKYCLGSKVVYNGVTDTYETCKVCHGTGKLTGHTNELYPDRFFEDDREEFDENKLYREDDD